MLRYLSGTKFQTLNLGGSTPDIARYTDSDWAGDRDDRKSIGAYIFRLGDGAVSWKSKNQSSVARSSEMAMCQAAKELVWIVGLLSGLSINLRTRRHIRRQPGSLALANNPVFHPVRNISTFSIISLGNLSRHSRSRSSTSLRML